VIAGVYRRWCIGFFCGAVSAQASITESHAAEINGACCPQTGSCIVAVDSMKHAARRPRPPLPSPASGSCSSRFLGECMRLGRAQW
jgi:hypothetical protein